MPLGPPVIESQPPKRSSRWWRAFSRILFIAISAEVGSVLLIFPWLDFWGQNYFSGWGVGWYSVWMDPYFRGAISGLGALNLSVAIVEVFHFRRPAPRRNLSIQ